MDVVGVIGAGPVGAHVGVVDERHAVIGEHPRELPEVAGDDVGLRVDQGIEAEDEVDGAVSGDGQRSAVIDMEADMPVVGEALLAMGNGGVGEVNSDQLVTQIPQIVRPASIPRCDLQDPRGRDEALDPREQRHPPLIGDSTPGRRPLIATLRPVIGLVPHRDVVGKRGHTA
jgi:hypothetical protein